MIDIKIYSNNNISVITQPKIATRFLQKWFYGDFDIEPTSIILNEDGSISSNNNFEYKETSIFLYRNPSDKLYSGLVQDFSEIFRKQYSHHYFNIELIRIICGYDSSYNEILNDGELLFFEKSKWNDNSDLYDIYFKSATLFLNYILNNNYFSNHIFYSLNLYSKLLSTITSKNILLIDIDLHDDILSDVLSKYSDTSNYTKSQNNRDSNNIGKDIFNKIIDNDINLKTKFNKIIENDLIEYYKLKKDYRNCIK